VIDIRQQEELLMAVGKMLPKKMVVYAIGGTAMMLLGIKNSTLDIDFIFERKEERKEFMEALKKLGAKSYDNALAYGTKENIPLMLELGNSRFDMFLDKVVSSVFSKSMKERARQAHEFGNLIVKVAEPSDIMLMKSATSREKDAEDIIAVISRHIVDWNALVEEAQEQVKLGNETAILYLGEKLELLARRKAIALPKGVLDKLWTLLHRQVKHKH